MARTTIVSLRAVIRLLMLGCLVLAGAPGVARAACSVLERGAVKFSAAGDHLLVPVTVNGISATFVLDTGASRSMVTPVAVQRLGLALDDWVATTMRGVGGLVQHRNADPRSLSLAGVPLQRRTVTHDTSLTVGPLPTIAVGGHMIDGLLGRDFLSLFDLEFDVPLQRLRLFDVRNCAGRFLPWSDDYASVSAEQPMADALVVPMTLDGTRLRALLDTGASSTLIALPGMVRLGLSPERLANDQGQAVHGIGPQSPEMHQHRFATLRIGPETLSDPSLWVAPVRIIPIVDALLGADWLVAQQRVWISFATKQVFFVAR